MDSASAPELGGPWAARAGGAGGGGGAGVADGWDGGTSGQESYREQQVYEPLPSHRPSNPRVSRWSDAPPGHGPVQDMNPGSDSRPSPAGLEPPYKKVRSEPQILPGQGSADYRDDSVAGYGADPGYGEGPPGLAYGRSGPGIGLAGSTAPGVGVAQNYGVSGGQSYGAEYGMQQMPTYGSNMPQNYGSQHLPQQSAPGSFAPGSAKATGTLFYKTKLCTKFKSGACTFNERCNFAHGMEELRKPPPGWEEMVSATGGTPTGPVGKVGGPFMGGGGRPFDGQQRMKTKLCRYFVDGNCPYGDRCNFLHGNDETQRTPGVEPPGSANPMAGRAGIRGPTAAKPNYKTRLCAKWEKGEPCDFGDKCHFAHGPTELQRYGGPSYPNGGTLSGDVENSSLKPEMTAPKMYADPGMMNPPPLAPLAVPYGSAPDFGSSVGSGPVSASNFNPYPSPGTAMKPYATSQEGINGASTNYNYWDEEKKWEGAAAVPRQPTIPTQGYGNQTAPWMADYSVDGAYSRRENDAGIGQYSQEQPQHQPQQLHPQQQHPQQQHPQQQHPQQLQLQQQQNVTFFRGGNIRDYQDPKQDANSPYGQEDSQNKYQGEVRNGDGGYFQGAYSEVNYPSQQVDYSARYNMAEAWGGKMQ